MAFNLKLVEDLFYEPLDPAKAEMIIEDMIPLGLTLIAGAPKSCKSWLMLDMCLAVANGKTFLGKETRACDVAYFCLEDREHRLQNRVLDLGVAPGQHFHYYDNALRLDQGFLKELEETLDTHSKIRLVVIDTLQKIRSDDSGTSTANQYGKDDAEISKLKALADKHGIAIVCVHHLRKMPDKRDPVNEILGSAAMSSVPDQILILKKDRFQTCGELSSVGRDTPQWKMVLKFEELRWHLLKIETEEEIARAQIPEVLYRIVDMVQQCGTWTGTTTQLLEAVGETQMPPNLLSASITKFYYEVFYPAEISTTTTRTSSERLRILSYHPRSEEDEEGGIPGEVDPSDIHVGAPQDVLTTQSCDHPSEDDHRSPSQHRTKFGSWKEFIAGAKQTIAKAGASDAE